MMASVAHDLRTPLTALHGHLEALAGGAGPPAGPTGGAGPQQGRPLAAALSQNDKVRRLSQVLFGLAALQSDHQVLHCERFNLDELVTDAVQKFELGQLPPLVTLAGAPPGRLGLAIAQRVALLHGGSRLPLPAPLGGTRLCLALPLAD